MLFHCFFTTFQHAAAMTAASLLVGSAAWLGTFCFHTSAALCEVLFIVLAAASCLLILELAPSIACLEHLSLLQQP